MQLPNISEQKDIIFNVNIILFFILNMLDIVSTIKALEYIFIYETNLIFNYCINNSILSFIVVKTILIFTVIGLYKIMYNTKYNSYTFYSLFLFNILLIFVLINNCLWWCYGVYY